MKKSTDSHGDIQPDAAPQQDGDRDGEEKEGGGGEEFVPFWSLWDYVSLFWSWGAFRLYVNTADAYRRAIKRVKK